MPLGEGLGHRAPDLGSFVDRGDPAAADFVVGDLTTDSNWHDMDLSGIVSSGAGAVLLGLCISSGAAGDQIRFRRNGNVNEANVARAVVQVAGDTNRVCVTVPCSRERIIEYNADMLVWWGIDVVVMGWWRG